MGGLFVDRVLELGSAIAEYALLVLFQNLVPLVFEFFDAFELWLFEAALVGPFLLQALQPSDLDFVQIVLFSKDVELLLHLDGQLVLQLLQLYLQLPPFLLVPPSQIGPLLLRVLLHQTVHSLLLAHL